MNSEVKMYSAIKNSNKWTKMLEGSSRSSIDAQLRNDTYQKVFSNYESLRNLAKTFSGATEMPLLSNQYFNASVASYVRSFAGYLTIERAMDQPTALLWYNDLLGVTDNRKVLPNLGEESRDGINGRFTVTADVSSSVTQTTNKKLIPGTVEIKLLTSDGTVKYTIRDNSTYVISKETEIGMLVETYQKLNTDAQKRLIGYLEALKELT